MIAKLVKYIATLAIFGCLGNQIGYAEVSIRCQDPSCYIQLAQSGQGEGSFIKKNQEAVKSSTNSALFTVYRIKCLNNSNVDGLIACNKALSIKSDPSLHKRRSVLSAKLRPKRPPPAATPKRVPQTRKVVKQAPQYPVRKIKPTNVQTAPPRTTPQRQQPKIVNTIPRQNTEALRKERIAKQQAKQNIIKIQQLLIKLGFNVSIADGIAGKNTKNAINQYLKLSNSKTSSKINNRLITELNNALKAHLKSDQQYKLAKKLSDDGKLKKALNTIEKSLNKTPWHKKLASLKATINTQITIINDARQQQLSAQIALDKYEENMKKEMLIKKEQEQKIAIEKTQKEEQKKREQRKLEFEKQLALQETLRKKMLEQKINQIITQAQTGLINNQFDSSLQTINEGLLLSPENPKILQLKDKILIAKKQYQLEQEVIKLIANTKTQLDLKNYERADQLIIQGLAMSPNHLKLRNLQIRLTEVKAKATKLAERLSKSKKLFEQDNFEEALKVTKLGLLIDPNHSELLTIQDKITQKIEQRMMEVSLKKQKVSNLLAIIQGKEKELLEIEKRIYSEKKQLLTQAQETLKKYWTAEKVLSD